MCTPSRGIGAAGRPVLLHVPPASSSVLLLASSFTCAKQGTLPPRSCTQRARGASHERLGSGAGGGKRFP